MVLAFSGKISSGKTSLTKDLSSYLGWPRVSFGDYVRSVAIDRGLDNERIVLQQLGEELLNNDIYIFCKAVLAQSNWQGGPLIIDGVRHKAVLETLYELISPLPLIHVHLSIAEDIRQKRLNLENKIDNLHSTEYENYYLLSTTADVILEVSDSLSNARSTLVQILTEKYGSLT